VEQSGTESAVQADGMWWEVHLGMGQMVQT
jgi:hypothetical protein